MDASENNLTKESLPNGDQAGNPLRQFAIKVGIVSVTVSMCLIWIAGSIFPDGRRLSAGIKKAFSVHETRLRFNGMLSDNPRVNWELSIDLERRGKTQDAIDEMIVAVGILERQNVRAEIMLPYVQRLETLKLKAKYIWLSNKKTFEINDRNVLNKLYEGKS